MSGRLCTVRRPDKVLNLPLAGDRRCLTPRPTPSIPSSSSKRNADGATPVGIDRLAASEIRCITRVDEPLHRAGADAPASGCTGLGHTDPESLPPNLWTSTGSQSSTSTNPASCSTPGGCSLSSGSTCSAPGGPAERRTHRQPSISSQSSNSKPCFAAGATSRRNLSASVAGRGER